MSKCDYRGLTFWLKHEKPEDFAKAQWPRIPHWLYTVYLVVVSLLFLVVVICSGAVEYYWYKNESDRKKWFIYLTNWSYVFITISSMLQATCAIIYSARKRPLTSAGKETSLHPLYKSSWVVYNVASVIAVVVCILYWALIYPSFSVYYLDCQFPEEYTSCGKICTPTCSDPDPLCSSSCVERCRCPEDSPVWYNESCLVVEDCPAHPDSILEYKEIEPILLHWIDATMHSSSGIYVVINLCVAAIPLCLLHYWHILVFIVVYIVFTVFYHVAGGTNAVDKEYIYSVLDWNEPGTAILYCLVTLIASIIFWLILYEVTKLRMYIWRRIYNENDTKELPKELETFLE